MRKKNESTGKVVEKRYSPRINKIVDEMSLMSDELMARVFDENIPATTLLLETILQQKIEVSWTKGQFDMKNPLVKGRSIRLDVLARDTNGRYFNCEVQRDSQRADPKRARFHSAMMDSRMLQEKQEFSELKDGFVIIITEKDYYHKNKPIYKVERRLDSGENFDDGSHIIYVNGSYDGDDDIGRLLSDMRNKDTEHFYHPELEKGVRHFKIEKEGRQTMSEAVEKYANEKAEEAKKKGIQKGIQKGIEQGISINVKKLLSKNMPADEVADLLDLNIEKVRSIEKEMLAAK